MTLFRDAWSPDGRELLFARRARPNPEDGSCSDQFQEWAQIPEHWFLLGVLTGEEGAAPDPFVVLDRWYGPSDATFWCEGSQSIPRQFSSGELATAACFDDSGELTDFELRIGGAVVDAAPVLTVLGTIELPAD